MLGEFVERLVALVPPPRANQAPIDRRAHGSETPVMRTQYGPALLFLLLVACHEESAGAKHGDTPDTDTADTDTDTDTGATGEVTSFSLEIGEPGTLVWATWTVDGPIADTSVSYRFEGGEWMSTPARDYEAGDQRQVVLGIPAATSVEVYLAGASNGTVWQTDTLTITTDDVPADLPAPTMVFHDPTLASSDRWILGSIDVSAGAWFDGPFYFFLLDREGRYVWWRKLEDVRTMSPQIGINGGYIALDATTTFDAGAASAVHRLTLDGQRDERLDVPGMIWAFSEGPDGTIFYDARESTVGPALMERAPDGTIREIWQCVPEFGLHCASNTVKYDAERDSILWSMYDLHTVVEIDRDSGAVLRQFGQLPGSYTFDTEAVGFLDQHWPNYTPDGTLLVSTHLPDAPDQQRAFEFEVDDASETLRLVWSYGEGVDEFAYYAGDAHRVPNGNTIVNYGTGGALREVTHDGELAFELDWDYIYVLGHNELVDDLYALLEGP